MRPGSTQAWKNVAGYAAVLVVSLTVTAVVLNLWNADLRTPFAYGGDGAFSLMFVQNILEEGWSLDSTRLGMPAGQHLADFPTPDLLHFGVIMLLGCLFHDPAVVFNLMCLLPFPMTALTSYFVLRRFRLGRLAALVAAVLYMCLPYHMTRFGGHLFLCAYYLLPLVILVAVRIGKGGRPAAWSEAAGDGTRRRLLSWDAGGAALVCVMAGLNGAYYTFFSCFLMVAAGAKAAFQERRWAPIGVATLLVLLAAGAFTAALTPTILERARYGKNHEASLRQAGEADYYGLNVCEMLLPMGAHRIDALARLRERFLTAPVRRATGEAWAAPLGFVGALGFLWLAGRFLLRRRDRVERVEDQLAYFNAVSVCLGTIGGIGAWFAFFISPAIRCYNRISIFIAFFALAGLFLSIHRRATRLIRGPWTRAAYAAGLAAVLVFGILDQTSPKLIPNYAQTKQEYASDADFGRRMEAALPPEAMVFQLPFVRFPENGPIHALIDYDLLRPYFHTRTLRFSYGAMRGRETSAWQAALSEQQFPHAAEGLVLAGFSGVYLDRAGYADNGAAAEAELSRVLDVEPMVSPNGRQSFFVMTEYAQRIRARFSDADWEARRRNDLPAAP
jgi:phosphoglycerol transferase